MSPVSDQLRPCVPSELLERASARAWMASSRAIAGLAASSSSEERRSRTWAVSSRSTRTISRCSASLRPDDLVVQLDSGERLDENARARAGAAVDDARQAAALLGLHNQHGALVARREKALLQCAPDWRPLSPSRSSSVCCELRACSRARRRRVSASVRGRVVGDAAGGQDHPLDALGERRPGAARWLGDDREASGAGSKLARFALAISSVTAAKRAIA